MQHNASYYRRSVLGFGLVLASTRLTPRSAASATHISENVSHVASSAAGTTSQCSRSVNLIDFAPVGDGISDDWSALQSAIDTLAPTGGTVLIPGGRETTYAVSRAIQLRSGVSISGEGATIRLVSAVSGTPQNVLIGAGVSDIEIVGLTIDGNRGHHPMGNHCIALTEGERVRLHHLHCIRAVYDGIYISGQDIEVSHCLVQDSGRHGVWLAGDSLQARIFANSVEDYGRTLLGAGIVVVANSGRGKDILLADNTIAIVRAAPTCASSILAGQAVEELVISGNSCRRAGIGNSIWEGASVEITLNCPHVRVVDNLVANSNYVGIAVGANGDCLGGVITGNKVEGSRASGIEVNATRITIDANRVTRSGNHGIFAAGRSEDGRHVDGTGYHLVRRNVVSQSGSHGIAVPNSPGTTVELNECCDNSAKPNVYSGIGFQSSPNRFTVQGLVFRGNRCYDTRTPKRQAYGIDTSADDGANSKLDGSLFVANQLEGNSLGQMRRNRAQMTPDTVID